MVETTTYASQALFFIVAIYVAVSTLRSPRRSNVFALAFFVLLAAIIAITWVQSLVEIFTDRVASVLPGIMVLCLPYVLLRLADEYSSVPRTVRTVSEVSLVIAIALSIYPGTNTLPVLMLLLAYFVSVSVYSARRFFVAAEHANGITRMRLRSISIASMLLGVALLSVGITAVVDGVLGDAVTVARQAISSASALLYFAGFSPPVLLRRAWQEPELRKFLHQTLQVPTGTEGNEAFRAIEELAAQTLGAPSAVIGLWNPETELIDFPQFSFKPGQTIGGRAFAENRPILSLDTIRDDPESREIYEQSGAYAVMAAPIVADDGPAGVIALYAPNPPIFAEDDLGLLTLLADQIGILLENRKHVQAQAELAALEASTRLKDEFLSVAAHDLKTPLTTILATGQFLERRLRKNGDQSPEVRSIVRLNRESVRLRKLVEGLLDASRIEQGQLVIDIQPTDLSTMLTEVVERVSGYETHQINAEIAPDVIVQCDALRIQQVAENILENAQKYSPPAGTVWVRLWEDAHSAVIEIADQGIGISPDDQAKIFDRYYRSQTAEYRTAQGIGLGLYICRAIIEQHEGSISVSSQPGEGSTFRITLPRRNATHHSGDGQGGLANDRVLQEYETG